MMFNSLIKEKIMMNPLNNKAFIVNSTGHVIYGFDYSSCFQVRRNNGALATFWLREDNGLYMAVVPKTEYQNGAIFDSCSQEDLLQYPWAREEKAQLLPQLEERRVSNE